VVKGLCHRTKQVVLVDEPGCDELDRLPRCGSCSRYLAEPGAALGVCQASPRRAMAYRDLVAETCEHFAWGEVEAGPGG
jgi:hypothetical protein